MVSPASKKLIFWFDTHVWWNTASQCVHQSRWHDQLSGETYFELPAPEFGISGFNNGTVSYLAQQGYNITYEGEAGSTSHVIIKMKDGLYEAASDPRKVSSTEFWRR